MNTYEICYKTFDNANKEIGKYYGTTEATTKSHAINKFVKANLWESRYAIVYCVEI